MYFSLNTKFLDIMIITINDDDCDDDDDDDGDDGDDDDDDDVVQGRASREFCFMGLFIILL